MTKVPVVGVIPRIASVYHTEEEDKCLFWRSGAKFIGNAFQFRCLLILQQKGKWKMKIEEKAINIWSNTDIAHPINASVTTMASP